MTIKEAYYVAVHDAQNRNPRTGYTQDHSRQLEIWTTRLAALAAFLGWDHTIIVADFLDEYDIILSELEKITPNRHEYNKHSHTYEIAGVIFKENHVPFGQI